MEFRGLQANKLYLSDGPTEEKNIDPGQFNGGDGPEDLHLANADQDREYGCKYCHKKFSNKQALGGHQNAHKVERAMEKNAMEMQENPFGYLGGGALPYPGMTNSSASFSYSYNKTNEFMNRASINRPYPSQQSLYQGNSVGYNPHSVLPMSGEPYVYHHLSGFNSGYNSNSSYSEWAVHSQFTAQPSPYVQNQAYNPRCLAMGSSSSMARPVPRQGLQAYAGSRHRIRRGENINQVNDPGGYQVDNSDVDLSLKL